jgi:hypothetical protein
MGPYALAHLMLFDGPDRNLASSPLPPGHSKGTAGRLGHTVSTPLMGYIQRRRLLMDSQNCNLCSDGSFDISLTKLTCRKLDKTFLARRKTELRAFDSFRCLNGKVIMIDAAIGLTSKARRIPFENMIAPIIRQGPEAVQDVSAAQRSGVNWNRVLLEEERDHVQGFLDATW